MFQTPGSRARRRRRAIMVSGPTTHSLIAHMIGSGVLNDPWAGDVFIEADMIGGADMVDGLTVSRNTAYTNEGGQGDRQSLIDIFFNAAIAGGGIQFEDITNFVDGATGANSLDSWHWSSVANTDGPELFIDFRPTGYFQLIDEIKWLQSTTDSHGNWVIEGFDGEDWYELKPSFTLGGATTQTITLTTNIGEYMFYRFRGVSGSRSTTPWLQEIQFKIARGAPLPAFGTSYADAVSTGARTSLITITTSLTITGLITRLIDGVTAGANNLNFGAGQTSGNIKFDFGHPVRVDEFKWYQSNSTNSGWWRWMGSDDDVTYHALGNWLQLTGAVGVGQVFSQMRNILRTFRYYKLEKMAGSSTAAGPFLYEIQFKALTGAAAGLHQLRANMIGAGEMEVTAILDTAEPDPPVWETGDRRSSITVTTNFPAPASTSLFVQEYVTGALLPAAPDFLVNGNTNGENKTFRGSHTTATITFDFGTSRAIQGFRWYQNWFPTTGGQGDHGTWQWYGSADNSSFTAVGNTFTLQASPSGVNTIYEPAGNTTAYRYWRLSQSAGSTKRQDNTTNYNSLYVHEIEFLFPA